MSNQENPGQKAFKLASLHFKCPSISFPYQSIDKPSGLKMSGIAITKWEPNNCQLLSKIIFVQDVALNHTETIIPWKKYHFFEQHFLAFERKELIMAVSG